MRRLLGLGIFLILLVWATGCAFTHPAQSSPVKDALSAQIFVVKPSSIRREISAPTRGVEVPDFTFVSAEGAEHHLRDLRGHPLVVNFWATWCPPCRAEMPTLNRAYEEHRAQGLIVLAVNEMESRGQVSQFVQEEALSLPVVLDRRGLVAQAYRVSGLPTSFFVDDQGIVVLRWTGMLTEKVLERGLDLIMKPQ